MKVLYFIYIYISAGTQEYPVPTKILSAEMIEAGMIEAVMTEAEGMIAVETKIGSLEAREAVSRSTQSPELLEAPDVV